MQHYIQANTNGRIHPADEPSISPLNRGFLYGDAIYEVWRTYKGVIFAWEDHWVRLQDSARALYLDLPFGQERMLSEIRPTVAAFRARTGFAGELYIRLQVTRGAGAIGLDVTLADQTDFVLLVQPCPSPAAAQLRDGLRLSLATELRRNPSESLNPRWKTGNYLNNLLGLREARARGADEVVMLNLRGEVTEAAVSNIAFVRKGTLVTPPLDAGILSGITRSRVLGTVAAAAGVPAREESVLPGAFAEMDECMLLSTTKEIIPVAAIDGLTFPVSPDSVTGRLRAAFTEHALQYAAAHPELRV